MNPDAIFGTLAFLAIAAWIGVEFVGLVMWWRKLMRKLGMYEDDSHESVDVTVRQMEDWPYAATRNASQHRNLPPGGKP
jgi:hypothetical protein